MNIYKLGKLIEQKDELKAILTIQDFEFIINTNPANYPTELVAKIVLFIEQLAIDNSFIHDKKFVNVLSKKLMYQIDSSFQSSFLTSFRGYAMILDDQAVDISKLKVNLLSNLLLLLFSKHKIKDLDLLYELFELQVPINLNDFAKSLIDYFDQESIDRIIDLLN